MITIGGTTYTSPEVAAQNGATVPAGTPSSGKSLSQQTAEANAATNKTLYGTTPEQTPQAYKDTAGKIGSINSSSQIPVLQPATPNPNPAPVNTPANIQAAQALGAAPQSAAAGASMVNNVATSAANAPSFYKPDPTKPQVVDAQGNPVSYDQFIAGGGKSDFSNVTNGAPPSPQPRPLTGVDAMLANDPGYQKLVQDAKAATDVTTQGETLVKQYQDMVKQAGIPAINKELLSTQKIINGTEDDIRKEVQAAGGFATDSQVLALSSARNKTLIQNYNNLLQTKQQAMDQVNTMIGLASQDRQYAQNAAMQQLNIDNQLNDYAMKFKANAAEGYNQVIAKVGYAGLYAGLKNDPNSISLAEQTLNLAPGSLQGLANYVSPQDQLSMQLQKAQIANVYSEIGARNTTNTSANDATAQAWATNIKNGSAKLSDVPSGLRNAVSLALSQGGSSQSDILKTTVSSIADLQKMVDSNQGFTQAVGQSFNKSTPSFFGLLKKTPDGLIAGSAAADFASKFHQVVNDVVLPNLNLLHGLGRVTDREFQALSASISSLSLNNSPAAFKTELDNLAAKINEKSTATNSQTIPTGTDGSAYGYPGYVSDGTQWVKK